MTPTDPRHGTSAGYLAHYRAHEPPCGPCREARYRAAKADRVARQRGQGGLHPAADVQAVCAPWTAMGLTAYAIAHAAGLEHASGGTIQKAIRNGTPVRRATFRAVLSVTEARFSDTAKVFADLTRRRVYSLQAAGHRLLDIPIASTGAWRTHTYIYVGVARMVREFYKIHEQATGSNVRTASRARAAGHQPPAAWDDPGTLAWPLGWTEPIIAATPEGVAVDDVVVARVLAGEALPTTRAEKLAIATTARARGLNLSALERRVGWNVHEALAGARKQLQEVS